MMWVGREVDDGRELGRRVLQMDRMTRNTPYFLIYAKMTAFTLYQNEP